MHYDIPLTNVTNIIIPLLLSKFNDTVSYEVALSDIISTPMCLCRNIYVHDLWMWNTVIGYMGDDIYNYTILCNC